MTAREPRYWPEDGPPPFDQRIETACASCGQPWCVHRDLGGYRLRCECGEWVRVPTPARPPDLPEIASQDTANATVVHDRLDDRVARPPFETDVVGAPRESVGDRQSLTNRAVIELVALMIALVGPFALVELLSTGPRRALFLPFASVVGGALVLLIGLSAGHHAFGGLRPARPRFFGEAMIASGVGLMLAFGLTALVPAGFEDQWLPEVCREIGVPWTLFVIALCPAVFEEIAFRGLMQGRLATLFGPTQGMWITGAAFALAHGLTLGFPVHVLLGFYLCWLRARSGSLYPGMLLHFLHNATIVVAL